MNKVISLFVSLLFVFSTLIFGFTGEIVQSFDIPSAYPTGLTFDGKYLWLADRKADKIYAINKENGQVVSNIPSPAYWPMGLTWDGEALWNVDVKGGIPLAENYNGVIYRLSPKDGTILKTVQAPTKRPRGLA